MAEYGLIPSTATIDVTKPAQPALGALGCVHLGLSCPGLQRQLLGVTRLQLEQALDLFLTKLTIDLISLKQGLHDFHELGLVSLMLFQRLPQETSAAKRCC